MVSWQSNVGRIFSRKITASFVDTMTSVRFILASSYLEVHISVRSSCSVIYSVLPLLCSNIISINSNLLSIFAMVLWWFNILLDTVLFSLVFRLQGKSSKPTLLHGVLYLTLTSAKNLPPTPIIHGVFKKKTTGTFSVTLSPFSIRSLFSIQYYEALLRIWKVQEDL